MAMTRWLVGGGLVLLLTGTAVAQLDETCTVALQNRTAPVAEDGTWVIRNATGTSGPYRVRAICVDDTGTRVGESDLAVFNSGESVRVSDFDFVAQTPIPTTLALSAPTTQLDAVGAQTQLEVLATYPDGSTADVALAATGTSYRISNEVVAGLDPDGLITAQSSGAVLVTARHEGAVGFIRIDVIASADSDGDGMPDDWEIANGLDPNNADDALGDADSDGLTNLMEFQTGTDPQNPDSDGDGLEDGDEVFVYGTNPLLADTDSDGVSDGLEVISGSDPNDAGSISLNGILDTIEVNPSAIEIIVNEVFLEGSGQVEVTGTLIDGTMLDITSSSFGTSYQSSDLTIVSFGVDSGRLYGGATGAATVTVTNSGVSVDVGALVERFAPEGLSFLSLPGVPQLVSLIGDHALVALDASGAGGADLLQVVNVSDPTAPAIDASLDVPELLAMEIQGTHAYLLGPFELLVADLNDPFAPSIVASVPLGPATTLGAAELVGSTLYLSTGTELVVFDVSDPVAPVEIGRSPLVGVHKLGADGDLLLALTLTRLKVVDATDPQDVVIVGETELRADSTVPSASDLAVQLGRAFVADGGSFLSPIWGGVRSIDLLDPVAPFIAGSTPDNLVMQVVATGDGLLFAAGRQETIRIFGTGGAEPDLIAVFFVPSFGSSVARDLAIADGLMYLVGRSRFSSRKGLYIGRYAKFEGDVLGPPTIAITTPADGDSILERRYFTVDVTAADDRRVVSVALYQDGELVDERFAEPFRLVSRAPFGVGSISLVALATDNTGQQSTSEPVVVTIADDTNPVVQLLSPSPDDSPGEGSQIELVASASDDVGQPTVEFSVNGSVVDTITFPPYRTTYSVPIGATDLTILLSAEDGLGQVTTDGPIVVPVLDDAPPSVGFISPPDGIEVVEGSTLEIVVGASDDIAVSTVEIWVDGVSQGTFLEPPFVAPFFVPVGTTALVVSARAVDSFGQATDASPSAVVVAQDPGTEVVGRVVDGTGTGLVGAAVSCLGQSGISGSDGYFSVLNVATVPGEVACTATFDTLGGVLSGGSESAIPEPLATTDVGDISVGDVNILAGYERYLAFVVPGEDGRRRVSEPFDPNDDFSGLDATAAGELLGVRQLPGGGSSLWTLDLLAAAGPQEIGVVQDAPGGSVLEVDDIAVDPTTGRLFGLVRSVPALFSIDRATGLANEEIAMATDVGGVSFDREGRLYAAGQSEIRELDLQSGSTLGVLPSPLSFAPVGLDIRPTDGAFVVTDQQSRLLILDSATGDPLSQDPADGPLGVSVVPALAAAPTTTVTGRVLVLYVVGETPEPLEGQLVKCGLQSATTSADGSFSISGVPASLGPVVVQVDGDFVRFSSVASSSNVPIPNGETSVGDIVIDESPVQFGDGD